MDNEFREKLTTESCRLDEILHSLSADSHPYSKFTHGNAKTLGKTETFDDPTKLGTTIDNKSTTREGIQKRLLDFFNTHYKNKPLTVALCSSLPLDTLESLATDCFSNLAPRLPVDVTTTLVPSPPYSSVGEGAVQKVIYVTPVKDSHHLKLIWILPSQVGRNC